MTDPDNNSAARLTPIGSDRSQSTIAIRLSGTIGDLAMDVAMHAPMTGVTGLFGPSGSGKTSLLRCVAGLTRLKGCVSIGDDVWQDDASGVFRPPHDRELGYVFQDARLFRHLNVRGNLMFGARRLSSPPSSDDFARLVELLSLGRLLDRSVERLSGGEQQRVSIGRALLARPRLLLMDEPLSAVDRAMKDEVLPYLENLSSAFSIPILYVSHDISEVSRLADWLVLIARGRVTAEGPLDDLLARLDLNPQTGRFEAGVLISGTVTGHDDAYGFGCVAFENAVLKIPGLSAPVGSVVRLRIRARDVAIATERPSGISIRNIVAGSIQSMVSEADSAFAEILIGVGGQRLRARITRSACEELGLAEGRQVFALIKSVAFDSRATIAR